MPPKRTSATSAGPPAGDANGSGPPRKLARTENSTPEDFASSVRQRLAASHRTGQACDRCKIRKIRCDGMPGGCSPCRQVNIECCTTDRITGRAWSRGYVEDLQNRNRDLENRLRDQEVRLRDYEARLLSFGVDVKAIAYPDPGLAPMMEWNPASAQMWSLPQSGPPSQPIASAFVSHPPDSSVSPTAQDLASSADANPGGHAPVADMSRHVPVADMGGHAPVADMGAQISSVRDQPWPPAFFDSAQPGATGPTQFDNTQGGAPSQAQFDGTQGGAPGQTQQPPFDDDGEGAEPDHTQQP
ncbi:MAG: hypothetical protein M1816_000888 [Peltula sp. TS41687]|nr:MAG: hypothetical protein M1816_000888 [Peltula sp. TS41687]